MDFHSTPTGISLSAPVVPGRMAGRRGLHLALAFAVCAVILLLTGYWYRFILKHPDAPTATKDKVSLHRDGKEGETFVASLKAAEPLPPAPVYPTQPVAGETNGSPFQMGPQPGPANTLVAPAGSFDPKAWMQQQTAGNLNGGTPTLSAAEQIRLDAYEREAHALHNHLSSGTAGSALPTLQQAAPEAAALLQQKPEANDPKKQVQEYASISSPPKGAYVVPAGTWIKGTLDAKVVSDLAGDLHARVAEDIYGERAGQRALLIPMGSILLGSYGGRLSYGNNRIVQAWNRIRLADSRVIVISDMNGMDADGSSGAKDKVNNHFGPLLRDAGLLTVFSAAVALTQRNQSAFTTPSVSSTLGQSVGSSLGQVGSEMIGRNLNLAPTAELRPGASFQTLVNRNLIFPPEVLK